MPARRDHCVGCIVLCSWWPWSELASQKVSAGLVGRWLGGRNRGRRRWRSGVSWAVLEGGGCRSGELMVQVVEEVVVGSHGAW